MAQLSISFEGSRRLTGPNLFSARPGAVLEALGSVTSDCLARWRRYVQRGRDLLDWPATDASIVRPHNQGASLFIEAPIDLLMTATELNEWAWQTARSEAEMHAPGHPLAGDETAALATLARMQREEAHPAFRRNYLRWREQFAPILFDDESVTLGIGRECRQVRWATKDISAPAELLPADPALPLEPTPVAMVTGSNGKTTSVRVLAAMLRAQGFRTAHNCTDGLFLNGQRLARGDYSGPQGARDVLRHPQTEAAVLETARGGMLRRGLAFTAADAALVTNISDDHFGEYGIDTLEELAEAKLVVARGLKPDARLILNADDPLLRRYGPAAWSHVDWFSLSGDVSCAKSDSAVLQVRDGRLTLSIAEVAHDLGAVADFPLSLGGLAPYNTANLMGASLVAYRLGVDLARIRSVLATFGAEHGDNPGRLQRYRVRGADVLTDYAHNPDGLAKLLQVARAINPRGRLALILGQAGNRDNTEILALADVAMRFRPDLLVLKDLQGYMRGRAFGEVPQLIREHLLDLGFDASRLRQHQTELEAVQCCLDWATPGDLLVLPVHASTAQEAVAALLERAS
ncbi:Mur ligase [Ahniella affigens]|uniref:Mur ligase n=1 Tax=Ahniella affigens TaxID=2021234 RepID=A0A2P1PV26_9GAMM|nr:Mur ligase family protein [Ahniella affigens]AVP98707.1 Mur ligase [Ahniella affigens]